MMNLLYYLFIIYIISNKINLIKNIFLINSGILINKNSAKLTQRVVTKYEVA
ncbi:hypothetical protein CNEO_610024 [Clostridium neonatale]|nr:hypothetical protein CNEO_610024 [Clostridium neonatale]